jgi:hypothetical protein
VPWLTADTSQAECGKHSLAGPGPGPAFVVVCLSPVCARSTGSISLRPLGNPAWCCCCLSGVSDPHCVVAAVAGTLQGSSLTTR